MMNKTAQGLAKKGRYGDTMLVHMAPSEVSGIASLTPGGMTVNPDTGLPEMFKFKDFFLVQNKTFETTVGSTRVKRLGL